MSIVSKIKGKIGSGETRDHLIKTFFVYGFIALSMIVAKILIARFFGQEELGVYTYFFSLVSFVFLFTSFGLPDAIAQHIIKDKGTARSVIKKASLLTLALTTLVFFITVPFFHFSSFGLKGKLFLASFVMYILVYGMHMIIYSILRGLRKFTQASILSLVNRTIFIVFIIGIYFLSYSFEFVLLFMSVAVLLSSIFFLGNISKKISQTKDQKIKTNSFVKVAFALFLMQVGFYSLRYVDVLTIKYLVDFANLGLYSAYSSVTNVIRLVAYVFPVVVVPMAAVSRYKMRESLRKVLIVLIPFSLLVLLGSYFVVPWLYGPEYNTINLPIYLVLSSTLLVVYSYFNSIFVGENKFSRFYIEILIIDFVISLVVNTFLNFVFISKWGIVGAPLATSLTIILKIVLNVYGLRRLRRVRNASG